MSNSHNEYEVFNALLEKFLSIPKTNSNPTFMEICQMGGDRFEERCSQILRFFLRQMLLMVSEGFSCLRCLKS